MGFPIRYYFVRFIARLIGPLPAMIVALPAAAQVASVVKVLSTPNPAALGQSVVLTAGVNLAATLSPTGSITLTDTVTCAPASSPTVVLLGTVTLGASNSATPGSGTLAVSSFPCVGANSIVGTYSGDSNYSPAASQPLVETIVGQLAPTATTLSASPNPSTVGQSVTFSVALKYTLVANMFPTGKVTFTDTGTGNVLGTGNVQTSGAGMEASALASIAISSLAGGTYVVQAVYSGDAVYAASTSQVLNQVVIGDTVIPTITGVVTAAGQMAARNGNIAQNTWIEIHGTNLSQATEDWSGQDFSKGLPTSLAGVSPTVDNSPAAISYVSPTQVNILTPLDNATGPAPVQLTTPYGKTGTVTPTMLEASPSFLVVNGAGDVAARHADYSLAGPAALSAPGYPYTPAKPGEIVLLYAVGFGQTLPPITDQLQGLGSLPTLPLVTIGGITATVQAAGISGPGLYQFNVVVPLNAPDGDLVLMAFYNGFTTQSGVSLAVQH